MGPSVSHRPAVAIFASLLQADDIAGMRTGPYGPRLRRDRGIVIFVRDETRDETFLLISQDQDETETFIIRVLRPSGDRDVTARAADILKGFCITVI